MVRGRFPAQRDSVGSARTNNGRGEGSGRRFAVERSLKAKSGGTDAELVAAKARIVVPSPPKWEREFEGKSQRWRALGVSTFWGSGDVGR
jgi:hypothetical protein